ncbi:ubiquitin domain-containing protein DSK2a-like isoform X2 [Carex littledalei]|uniref:Ubiquitin domain-containing protein DSK2a-like isoform X2 n=1 Tax=Carex littledalei TaxID=544730 RepID=A0A833QM11_9POAL|nr:ubiquitin domain-containing protein DSK2a-like isoform X2 [Carex littledalei]
MGGGEGVSGDESGAPAAVATVHIRCSNGNKFSVQTELDATVRAFKTTVATSCDVPAEQQRLIYKGRILKDEQTLSSYGVEADHTIHLVRASPPMTSPNTTTTASQGAAAQAPNSGSSPAAGTGGFLFPGLGLNSQGSNNSGLFGSLPDLDMMQQQLSQNPGMMRDIMNTPAIQSLMNNPDLMRNIIMNNPQMRDIIDRNPDLAHILNDPSILRQTLEAARNPELMREMMRNTDRAMSNIESSPEGFNMLRRMYETVQEPFLNATTMGGDADSGANPFAALFGNQAGNRAGTNQAPNTESTGSNPASASPAPNTNPLPNPWSTNTGAAQTGTRSTTGSETRGTPAGGLGGAGMPDLTSLLGGGMPDPSHFNQLLQNPAMMQMMQNMMSDPQTFNQLLGFNPTLRSLLDTNPQLRDMIQNPDFIRQLMSPETMQQILSLQQSLQGLAQLGRQQSGQEQNQTDSGAVPGAGLGSNANLELLRNLFGGLGAGGFSAPANQSNVPPEELYATQLTQLQEMGFIDAQENIRALIATSGNVHAAVERLLGNFGL